MLVLADGGGHATIAVDYLSDLGVTIPTLQTRTLNQLGNALPDAEALGNPLDLAGAAEIAHAGGALLGLGLLGRQSFGGPVNMLYNNAALLFMLALFGGLVLLALRMSAREHRTPPPMFVVSLHAVMAMTALLLLVVGYTHP